MLPVWIRASLAVSLGIGVMMPALSGCGERAKSTGMPAMPSLPGGGAAGLGTIGGGPSAGQAMGGATSMGGDAPVATPGGPPTAPVQLTVGDRPRPLNVEGLPLFGWWPQDGPNEIQTAYHVRVLRDDDQSVVWDSDKVASSEQSYVPYAGPELARQTSYSWTVRTWDSGDQASPWSDPARFDTGLSDSDWGASWIRRDSTEPDDYTLARAELLIGSSPVTRARVFWSACHQAELYVNGQLIDRGPAFAHPDEAYYQAADVTDHAKPGEPLAVGSIYHWYGSGQGRPASARGLLLRLVVQHADGSEQILVTDGSWRVKRASAWQTGAPKRNGDASDYVERIDARSASAGWNEPGHATSDWQPAVVIGAHPTAPFTHLIGREARIASTLVDPVSVQVLPDGAVVADFGAVVAARPRVHFSQGVAGRSLAILTGYRLLPDGHVSTAQAATQGVDMSFSYTQANGSQDFVPFTHLAWRYLQLAPPGETLPPGAIQASLEHTDVPELAASFESSNATLNDVFALLQRSSLYSAAYQFVDTPTREKGQFLGDAANISDALMAGYLERDLTQQALAEFARSQARHWPDGRVNAVYPNGDGKRDIPDFTQVYVGWAWRYYLATGDESLLEQLYPVLRNIADYCWRHRDAQTGLITNLAGGSGDYQYGIIDWPIAGRFAYDMTTTARTTVNILAVDVLRSVAQAAAALAHPESTDYDQRASELAAAINEKLRRADGIYVDGLRADGTPSPHASQHASSYALAFAVAPAANHAALGTYVASLGMQQGPMTAHSILRALAVADLPDQVIARLTDAAGPGWANILERGGTFTWETWSPTGSESESHGWGSQALVDFTETLLGVRVTSPGAATIDIVIPRTTLTSASGTVPSQRGPIQVSYEQVDGALKVAVDVPVNVKARVLLPLAGSIASASGTGAPLLLEMTADRAVYAAGSGRSEFVVEGTPQ